jgi:ATP-dependent DNA helicase RecQ
VICVKEYLKIRTAAICCFQDPSLEDMALKYPISLHELIHIHGLEKEKPKNMVLILSN